MANILFLASELEKHFTEEISDDSSNFPRVIDGADSTLDAIERVPVNEKNRPLQEIRLTHV